MKKFFCKKIICALMLSALVLACSGSRLLAQQGQSTKVAIVNVGQVFAKYEKAIKYKADMDEMLKPFKTQSEKWKNDILSFQKAIQDPATKQEDKIKYQKAIVDYKRALEDLEVDTQKKVSKKQEEQITGLFRDLNDGVKSYAMQNGIHLVLGYGEQIEGDLFTFGNISRKMQGMDLGCTTPLFFVPGVDISTAVADALNQRFRSVAGTPVGNTKKQ